MTYFSKIILVIALLMSSQVATARVFSFEEDSLAPYLNIRGGISSMGEAPYRWQTAATYSGDEAQFLYGGEFGVYVRGASLGVSLGVLVHTFDPVLGGRAFQAGGTQLFSVDMEGLAYAPQLVFDYQLSGTKTYLWKLLIGGGYQFAELESTYTFTTAGQALNGGQATVFESYRQEVPYAVVGVSTEFMMSGSTTMSISAGYHYSFGQEWTYGQGGRNFAGTHAQGDKVVFEDSTSKNIDWSYAFIQIGFQFYVNTVR